MRSTIRQVTLESMDAYPKEERTEWVKNWAGQVVLAVTAKYWTEKTHIAINEGMPALKAYTEACTDDINRIVVLVRGKLSKMLRTTLGALVVMDVHARDTLVGLLSSGIKKDDEFAWLCQLRYYLETDSETGERDVWTKMINSTLAYGYEYLGNSFRLVVTPLTDRCYRTLFGALELHLGMLSLHVLLRVHYGTTLLALHASRGVVPAM